MALPVHKLEILDNAGSPASEQKFQDIIGVPDWEKVTIETFRRPGVDGVGLRELGTTAGEFTIATLEYRDSLASARTAAEAYLAYIGSGAQYGVRLTMADVVMGDFAVVGVALAQQPQAIGTAVGSLIASPAAILIMRWKLIDCDLVP